MLLSPTLNYSLDSLDTFKLPVHHIHQHGQCILANLIKGR
jgi:hypothetical protein